MSNYSVTVPDNIHAGGTFICYIDGQPTSIQVPPGAGPGSKLNLNVSYPPAMNRPIPAYILADSTLSSSVTSFRISNIWAYVYCFFYTLNFTLLVSAFSVPAFAKQSIGASCLATNPATNAPLRTLYYSMYSGLCSDKSMRVNSDNFCIRWSSNKIWGNIDSIAGSNMEGEASYNWPTTAILTPFAAGFALIAALLTLWAVVKPRTLKGNSENCLLVSIGTLFSLLSWIFALISLNLVIYSNTMFDVAWERFYIGNPDDIIIPINLVTSCNTTVVLLDGGVLLAVAVSFSFFITLYVSLSNCCLVSFERMTISDPFSERVHVQSSVTASA